MERRRRIILFGNSVILGTVGASLRRLSRYDVITMPPSEPENLNSLVPDVVIFDLEAARPGCAFSLLENQPGLLLIGVSPDKNMVKMWSGQQLRELSTTDLMKAIEQQSHEEVLGVDQE